MRSGCRQSKNISSNLHRDITLASASGNPQLCDWDTASFLGTISAFTQCVYKTFQNCFIQVSASVYVTKSNNCALCLWTRYFKSRRPIGLKHQAIRSRCNILDKLVKYAWPGNVRELKNVIERMIVMSPGSGIGMESLPGSIYTKRHLPAKGARLKDAVEETERYLIEEAYREHRSWKKVAEVLGVDRTTIFRKATKYHIAEQ